MAVVGVLGLLTPFIILGAAIALGAVVRMRLPFCIACCLTNCSLIGVLFAVHAGCECVPREMTCQQLHPPIAMPVFSKTPMS